MRHRCAGGHENGSLVGVNKIYENVAYRSYQAASLLSLFCLLICSRIIRLARR